MFHFRVATILFALLVISCGKPQDPIQTARVESSELSFGSTPTVIQRGLDYLLRQQSPDGAWRSDVYATFKDGPSLTPLVLRALQQSAQAGFDSKESQIAREKAIDYLLNLTNDEGILKEGEMSLDYPIYTAALVIEGLSQSNKSQHIRIRDGWVHFLINRQLNEKLGWNRDDKPFGGWGYCRIIPMKPAANAIAAPLIESNLSATVYALSALKSVGYADPTLFANADLFLSRCQNADGGFFFIYDDPVRNKAGKNGSMENAFNSYGSTTADGAFIARMIRNRTGKAAMQVRPEAAIEWLTRHFSAESHPGNYIATHEVNREAVYFYYLASLSRAFCEAGVCLPNGSNWVHGIEGALAKRQRNDGSWSNPVELVRENDTLVATSHAVLALAYASMKR